MNEPKQCFVEGCEKWLGHNNTSGYCRSHTEQRPERKARKPYKHRKQRETKEV